MLLELCILTSGPPAPKGSQDQTAASGSAGKTDEDAYHIELDTGHTGRPLAVLSAV